jgi:hypothetical protein
MAMQRGRPSNLVRRMSGTSLAPREEHPALGHAEHQIVLNAREALIREIERCAAGLPNVNARALRMVAVSGLFADAIAAIAGTTHAVQLLQIINVQLAQSGLRLGAGAGELI